jgi:type VI protein secretion system component VasK
MTIQLFTWVLMNGLIVVATWGGIVLWNRQKRAERQQERLEDEITNRQEALDQVNQRVAELEQRLDLSERLLKSERQPVPRADN